MIEFPFLGSPKAVCHEYLGVSNKPHMPLSYGEWAIYQGNWCKNQTTVSSNSSYVSM